MVLTILAQARPLGDLLSPQVVNVDCFEAILVNLHLLRCASSQVDDSLINASDRTMEWLDYLVDAVLCLSQRLCNQINLYLRNLADLSCSEAIKEVIACLDPSMRINLRIVRRTQDRLIGAGIGAQPSMVDFYVLPAVSCKKECLLDWVKWNPGLHTPDTDPVEVLA